MLRAEPTPDGWQVVLTDAAGRFFSTDLPDGPPAVVRAALTHWIETTS